MSNYYTNTRTNWFRVKDKKEFMDWLTRFGSELLLIAAEMTGKDTYFAMLGNSEFGDFPYIEPPDDPDDDDQYHGDFMEHVATQFLHDDDILVILESGAEKMHYIGGVATAYDSNANMVDISIDGIYDKARREFPNKKVQELDLRRP